MARGGARPNSGGPRPGSGRPKAKTTVKTREIADQLAADGKPLPLEIMVARMRELWAHEDDESRREAVQIANMAASYLHPRLQPRPAQKISLALPALTSFDAVAEAHAIVAAAMATGELDAEGARAVVAMLTAARESLEATVFEARLAALENNIGARK
jgi:hypothetical protein